MGMLLVASSLSARAWRSTRSAAFFSAVGCHYYEGKKVPDMPFNDWRKLPSLTPQSLLHLESAPEPMQKLISQAQALYDEASRFGIFDDENRICTPDAKHVEMLQALIKEVGERTSQAKKAADLVDLQALADKNCWSGRSARGPPC